MIMILALSKTFVWPPGIVFSRPTHVEANVFPHTNFTTTNWPFLSIQFHCQVDWWVTIWYIFLVELEFAGYKKLKYYSSGPSTRGHLIGFIE